MFSSTPLSLASCITFGLLAGSLAGGYCGGRLINDNIVIVVEWKVSLLKRCHPISRPSNPGMDHEGQFYMLLFPASWLGWQLLWPLGNLSYTPLSCLLRLVIIFHRLEVLLLGRVLSGVCCSVTTANASLLVTQYSSLHRCLWMDVAKLLASVKGCQGIAKWVFFYSLLRSQARNFPLPLLSHAWPRGNVHCWLLLYNW